MKKVASEGHTNEKRPKTALDKHFLAAVARAMKSNGITSDRAMSLALGRNADFINKVRHGLQSATAEAWDALVENSPKGSYLDFYFEVKPIKSNSIEAGLQIANDTSSIGTEENNIGVDRISLKLHQTEPNIENWALLQAAYNSMLRENDLLRSQLADKERIIQLLK